MIKRMAIVLGLAVVISLSTGCSSDDENSKAQEETKEVVISDIEVLTRENHPKWLDDMDTVYNVWEKEIEDRRILIDESSYQNNDILEITDFSTDISEADNEYIGQLSFNFYNFDEKIPFDKALNVISDYLPYETIQTNYDEIESYYMIDDRNSQIKYWKHYKLKEGLEEPEKMDSSFYICAWSDLDGYAEEANINVVIAITDNIEDAEIWEYNFFE